MLIEYSTDSGEAFQRAVLDMPNYCVEIHPLDTSIAPFDAELIGISSEDQWFDAVSVRKWDEAFGEGTGDPFDVRVSKVVVY